MQPAHPKPKRVKKPSNTLVAWIVLGITLGGLGSLLWFTSHPASVRYIAVCQPFTAPPIIETPTIEEPDLEFKEEELIELTQPK